MLNVVGIVLGLIAIGLILHFRKDQKTNNDLFEGDIEAARHAYNALMEDFNHYQIETDRKITELEKQLEIKSKKQDKRMEKHLKELPFIIGKVVGQIELAQDTINRKM